jgi:hypothetical protein
MYRDGYIFLSSNVKKEAHGEFNYILKENGDYRLEYTCPVCLYLEEKKAGCEREVKKLNYKLDQVKKQIDVWGRVKTKGGKTNAKTKKSFN